MIKYLESLLFEKTKDTQSEILFAQWSYDKKIIPIALQSVSNLFPHYSLHDESHSITIVNNIVRILGKENIAKLSAINIWLLLEAAYCHDLGMVVSGDKIMEALSSKKFIQYFKMLLSNEKDGLYEFANKFHVINDKIEFKDVYYQIEATDGMKFILAEYFRRLHAERSKEIINNPINELSLVSPRGAIPPRIFKILGNICSSHTLDFRSVMELPFVEVGIDVEDAHPRFIACLLRVGDLLDLDNNRFSEVMLRTLSKVPISTLNHKAKHLSIESFRVDKTAIEIRAKCTDYDTASITQHWFNYLNSEISSQMINWNTIVPDQELGYLPTIGELRVELLNYDYIDGKNKPKFSVDTDKALALLQGAGLYDGAYQCIREILQNAVDSSLIRLWFEHENAIKRLTTPQSDVFLKLAEQYPIAVNIKRKDCDDEYQRWEISIIDNGTGISSKELKFLMNTGSSTKNIERMETIERMPVWMRPSGTFGIGFQSIFMLTDVVKIETKSYHNEEFQAIELNSPNSKKDGDILIQKLQTSHSTKPGCKIEIEYSTPKIPKEYRIASEHKNASKIAANFDPFTNESLDIELGKILDEVLNFAQKTFFKIDLIVDNNFIETKNETSNSFEHFDETNALELNIRFGMDSGRWRTFTYYKGQPVENRISYMFLGFDINIHQENAAEVLTLNRNKIKDEFQNKLFKQILFSAYKIITQKFDNIFTTKDDKVIGSMFLHFYSQNDVVKEFNIDKFNHWEEFEIILTNKEKITLKKLFTSIDKLKIVYNKKITYKNGGYNFKDLYEIKENDLILTLSGGSPSFLHTDFLLSKVNTVFKSASKKIIKKNGNQIREVTFSKEEYNLLSDDEILTIISAHRESNPYSARAFIPCSKEYSNLRINNESVESYVYHYNADNGANLPYPKMLSPYVRERNDDNVILKTKLNDRLYNWVYENRYDPKTTRQEIVDSYAAFCKRIDLDAINKVEMRDRFFL